MPAAPTPDSAPDWRAAAGFCLDMDGVLYRGDEVIPGAVAFIDFLQSTERPFLLITNHACRPPAAVSAKLAGMGIHVPAKQIYTSGEATGDWLAAQGATRVFVLGEAGLRESIAARGITIAPTDVSHVVVGLERELRYEDLTTAYRLIAAGAIFVGTNPDLTYPIADGPAPEAGWLLAAMQALTEREPIIVGKPAAAMYELAAARLGLPVHQLAMIGDRLDTDIAGAQAVGMAAILVLTGHATRADAAAHPQPPTLIAPDLHTVLAGLTS